MTRQLYPYFTPLELRCHCGNCQIGQEDMSPRFMRRVVDLRKKCDFPFVVSSAARCSTWNDQIYQYRGFDAGTHLFGPHTPLVSVEGTIPRCHSIDILCYGERAVKLVGLARSWGFTGIGIKQHGKHADRFVHLDDLENGVAGRRPWIWSYS